MTLDGPVTIFGSTTSPFVRKVRVCCLEAGLPHEFKLTPPWSPTAGVDRLNPLHKVPALGLADGTLLFDSRVIAQYVHLRAPQAGLIPTDAARLIEVLQIEAVADGVGDAVALYTQEGWRREEARSTIWLQRQRDKVEKGLAWLNDALASRQSAGPGPDLAEIATGCALGFATFWIRDLPARSTWPVLAARDAAWQQRAAWRETTPFLAAGAGFPAL
jgi:glutathione S-transferase